MALTARAAAALGLAALVGAAGLAGVPAGATAGPARTLLDRSLRGLRDARAPFTQTRTSALLGASGAAAPGTLEFRVPRLLRLEFAGAVPTTILVRGDSAWIAQPRAGQVIRTSARASGAPPLPFLEESVAVLERSYTITETGSRTLHLVPRAAGTPWRAVELLLDGRTGMPRRVVVAQGEGEELRLEFGRWTVNRGVPAARFAPVFARGAKVVDL